MILISVVISIFGATKYKEVLLGNLLLYGGGALVGFSCSAFFSCQPQFLIRGSKDNVYLIRNSLCPKIFKLIGRKTLSAFGGIWHEISHVSERMINHLCIFFRKKDLCLKNAELIQVEGEKSVFAVLLGSRFGIPDPETLECIWGIRAKRKYVDLNYLDKIKPGRDLVSMHYWLERDKKFD